MFCVCAHCVMFPAFWPTNAAHKPWNVNVTNNAHLCFTSLEFLDTRLFQQFVECEGCQVASSTSSQNANSFWFAFDHEVVQTQSVRCDATVCRFSLASRL